jgi:hypothetical protein
MKYRFVVLFLFLGTLLCSAQERGNVLAQMNAVKLDPDCLYGYCALSSADRSRTEALADLAFQVETYLREKAFKYVHRLEQCPEGTVKTLVYTKGNNYYRTVAYIDKAVLEQQEKALSQETEALGVNQALTALKGRLATATTLADLESLIAGSEAASFVRRGTLTFDTPQDDVDWGYLVYYDKKTGRILEIRTPRNAEGKRFNAKTGASIDPEEAPQGGIDWIRINEPMNP